jgi:hypothetical protein
MGWTYNTPDGVPNDGPHITAVAIVFTAMSLSILLLRFYVRGVMIKAIGAGKQLSCSSRLSAATDTHRRLRSHIHLGMRRCLRLRLLHIDTQ